MSEIDQIRINFTPDTLWVLNIALAFLTFGVALDIRISDFKQVFENPKKVFIGLTSQWLLMPILTLLIVLFFNPEPSIALGMAMVAACPGGNVSNYATHLAKGNSALSVTMTSIVTLSSIVTTPLIFGICAIVLPQTQSVLKDITLDPFSVFKIILQLIIVPLTLGMYLTHKHTNFANRIRKFVKTTSMLIFMAIIVGAVLANTENIFKHIHLVFLIVLLHNGSAYVVGYYFAKANKLPQADARAIAIETGIQNSGLGLILIFNFFENLGGMILVAAFWGVWDLISSFGLAMWWRRTPPDNSNPYS